MGNGYWVKVEKPSEQETVYFYRMRDTIWGQPNSFIGVDDRACMIQSKILPPDPKINLRLGLDYFTAPCFLKPPMPVWRQPLNHYEKEPSFQYTCANVVRFRSRCPTKERDFKTAPPELTTDQFSARIKGGFMVDFDQDGDRDIVVWLISGQYLFYRQESCEGMIALSP